MKHNLILAAFFAFVISIVSFTPKEKLNNTHL